MKKIFAGVIVAMVMLGGMAGAADRSDSLKSLLVDIAAWSAEEAEGSSVNMGAINLVTANRSYTKGDATLNVTVLVGSSAMIQGQTQIPTVETDEVKISRGKINGFDVIQSFDKKENSGAVIITLAQSSGNGALFLFSFTGISSDEALKIAKGFNWNTAKSSAEKLLK